MAVIMRGAGEDATEEFLTFSSDAASERASSLSRTRERLRRLSYVAFYDKPLVKFERLLETYPAFAPRGLPSFVTATPSWLKEKLVQKNAPDEANGLDRRLEEVALWSRRPAGLTSSIRRAARSA
jgi:hypothetical protein